MRKENRKLKNHNFFGFSTNLNTKALLRAPASGGGGGARSAARGAVVCA